MRNSKLVATEMEPGRMMQDPDIIALHHTLDLITFEYYSTNGRVLTRLKEWESKTRFSTFEGSVCENISLPVGVIDSVESEKKI